MYAVLAKGLVMINKQETRAGKFGKVIIMELDMMNGYIHFFHVTGCRTHTSVDDHMP